MTNVFTLSKKDIEVVRMNKASMLIRIPNYASPVFITRKKFNSLLDTSTLQCAIIEKEDDRGYKLPWIATLGIF